MLRYFGENPSEPCGKCDVCRNRNKKKSLSSEEKRSLKESVLYMLGQSPRSIDYLINESAEPKDRVIDTTRRLLKEGAVKMTSDGLLTLS